MFGIARNRNEAQWYDAIARQARTDHALMLAAYMDWMTRRW